MVMGRGRAGEVLKLSGSRLRLGYKTIQKGPGFTVTLNSRPLSRLRQPVIRLRGSSSSPPVK